MARIFNFSAGPGALPLEVLQEAQADFTDYKGSGMSIMEMSHRGKIYAPIQEEAAANLKELMGLGEGWEILFIQGGASLQFAMIPMNFLPQGASADYVVSGNWASQAAKQARLIGNARSAADCAKDIPTRMPAANEIDWDPAAAYAHITTNETISGAEYKDIPTPPAGVPLIADMSSDILSCPRDYTKFSMFYAGAQKNLGPAGFAMVAIRKDLAEKGNKVLPTMLQYSTFIEKGSMYNTPPCYSIYMLCLVTRWLKREGLENVFKRNAEKAAKLYAAIDASSFYRGTALPEWRSDMNITFRLPTEELEAQFCAEAKKAGLDSLKGHRSVGGLRASIYNAMPVEGVDALIDFMQAFEKKNA